MQTLEFAFLWNSCLFVCLSVFCLIATPRLPHVLGQLKVILDRCVNTTIGKSHDFFHSVKVFRRKCSGEVSCVPKRRIFKKGMVSFLAPCCIYLLYPMSAASENSWRVPRSKFKGNLMLVQGFVHCSQSIPKAPPQLVGIGPNWQPPCSVCYWGYLTSLFSCPHRLWLLLWWVFCFLPFLLGLVGQPLGGQSSQQITSVSGLPRGGILNLTTSVDCPVSEEFTVFSAPRPQIMAKDQQLPFSSLPTLARASSFSHRITER